MEPDSCLPLDVHVLLPVENPLCSAYECRCLLTRMLARNAHAHAHTPLHRLSVLELAMRKLLRNVVPADLYAEKLVHVCLQQQLPRWGGWEVEESQEICVCVPHMYVCARWWFNCECYVCGSTVSVTRVPQLVKCPSVSNTVSPYPLHTHIH